MNDYNPTPDPKLDALFALARQRRPDTTKAEFAFETRLMARLREGRNRPDHHSAWAMVSWRLLPFFAACVIALTVWQAETSSDSDDASIARLTNPLAADIGSN
jgi:hypothetical protein